MNFKFDPKEAKKLLSAAGFTSPIKAKWSVPELRTTSALPGRMPAVESGWLMS